MRITENRMTQMILAQNEGLRSRVGEASRKLSTGVAVERPSHDPVRWAEGMRHKARLEMNGSHLGAVERSREKLDLADDALGRIGAALSRAREVATQMATGTQDAQSRAAAALEVQSLFAGAVSAANQQGVDGEFLFAGAEGQAVPFDAAGVYQGDASARTIQTAEGQTQIVTVPGTLLTAANGLDVLSTLSGLEAALLANDQAAVQTSMVDLATAIGQVGSARAQAGSASSGLESTRDALEAFEVHLSESISAVVATDPIVAATELANLSNQLETSRAVAQRITVLMDPNR